MRAAEAAQEVWVLFLVPILAIFFLRDGSSFLEALLPLVQSRSQREFLQDVLLDLNQMLAQFIRAQLTLAALSLVAYTAFLSAVRVPYALMLGTVGGALEFVPLAGPLLAGVAMMIVAVLAGYQHWAFLLLFLLIWRMIPRLRNLSADHGSQGGIASAGGLIRYSRGRRNRWNPRRLSFHSSDGQFAHRLAALAHLEKRKFGPLNEYSFPQELGKGVESQLEMLIVRYGVIFCGCAPLTPSARGGILQQNWGCNHVHPDNKFQFEQDDAGGIRKALRGVGPTICRTAGADLQGLALRPGQQQVQWPRVGSSI